MFRVCTAEQMRNIDRMAMESAGIPGIVLMENAALACVEEIIRLQAKNVGIFCGRGNNGGDGLAIARHLMLRGIAVTVYYVCGTDYDGDARINYEIYENMHGKTCLVTEDTWIDFCPGHDLLVDAIFGTGIRGAVEGIAEDVILWMNQSDIPVLSVDIPSGVQADNGAVDSVAVNADVTVTFAAYKRGLLLFPGADYTGRIVVAGISIPQYIIDRESVSLYVPDADFIKEHIPKRRKNSHKGDYGKVLILGGSAGMTGAACLSAEAALRCGCGLVTVGIPESLNPVIEAKLTEAMSCPMPEEDGHLSVDAKNLILEKMEQCDALLFGPGIGRSEAVCELLGVVLANAKIPVIVDADGLYALSLHPEYLEACGCSLIFTPHAVEFARLSGLDAETVEQNRLDASGGFASTHSVTLVLKGHHTVITAPDGMQYLNMTGNSGMAKGVGHINVDYDNTGKQSKNVQTMGCTDCSRTPLACSVPTLEQGLDDYQ